MTDQELKRLLQEKFKSHELDLPANDWSAIEKRLSVVPSRISVAWRWAMAAGAAAVILIAILLYTQPSNSLSTEPTIAKSRDIKTEIITDATSSTPLVSQLVKTEKDDQNNKKRDTKKDDKQVDKHVKSKHKTTEEKDNTSEGKEKESIESTPQEEENQVPSWHEHEDDGAEYIVQTINTYKEKQILVAENANNDSGQKSTLSIDEAEALIHKRAQQQTEALEALEQKNDKQSEPQQWNLGLHASFTPELLAVSKVTPTVLMDNSLAYRSMNRVNVKHDLPLMVGLSVGIPFAKGFSIQTGLNYAYIHSTITNENTLTGDYAVNNQKLHYLGIPVMFSYKVFDYNIVQCYVSGGGMAEKGLVKNVQTYTFDQTNALLDSDSKEEFINGFQFSLTANIGLGVRLYKGLNLFFEPGFTWYIPNNTSPQPENIRTEHPYNLSLTAGLRYNLNQ